MGDIRVTPSVSYTESIHRTFVCNCMTCAEANSRVEDVEAVAEIIQDQPQQQTVGLEIIETSPVEEAGPC